MYLIAKVMVIRIARAKFHCNRLTSVHLRLCESNFLAHSVYKCLHSLKPQLSHNTTLFINSHIKISQDVNTTIARRQAIIYAKIRLRVKRVQTSGRRMTRTYTLEDCRRRNQTS